MIEGPVTRGGSVAQRAIVVGFFSVLLGIVAMCVYGIAIAVATLLSVSPAFAQARPPVSVSQGLVLVGALRALDGRHATVKGSETAVMVPYEFGSPTLRLRIAKNIALLAQTERAAEEARLAILRDVMGWTSDGVVGNMPTPGTPQHDEFLRRFQAMLDGPVKESEQLARLSASELRLDKNEIPVTVLSMLIPILDE